jgi:hypothetical protein
MTDTRNMDAQHLYHVIVEMAQKLSNPVLEVLGEIKQPEQGVKYPSDKLDFGRDDLLAYYHSHPEPWLRPDEHGHFHFFIRQCNERQTDWAHVAALSMDTEGQPRQWIMTNRWVTGGDWLFADDLYACLHRVMMIDSGHVSLLEAWLYYVLKIFLPDLKHLLRCRDEMADTAGLDNREQYDLAQMPVDMLSRLQFLLQAQAVDG